MWIKNKEVKNTMQINFMLFLCLVCLNSCQNESKLNNAKFKEVLHKIHQCEAYNEMKYGNVNAKFLEDCKSSAMKESQMSQEQFEKTMNYYTQHSKEFEALYDTILQKYP